MYLIVIIKLKFITFNWKPIFVYAYSFFKELLTILALICRLTSITIYFIYLLLLFTSKPIPSIRFNNPSSFLYTAIVSPSFKLTSKYTNTWWLLHRNSITDLHASIYWLSKKMYIALHAFICQGSKVINKASKSGLDMSIHYINLSKKYFFSRDSGMYFNQIVSESVYWSWGRGFDSRYFQNFKCGLGLKWGPPSLVRFVTCWFFIW